MATGIFTRKLHSNQLNVSRQGAGTGECPGRLIFSQSMLPPETGAHVESGNCGATGWDKRLRTPEKTPTAMVPAIQGGVIHRVSMFLRRTSYFPQLDTSPFAESPCRGSSLFAALVGRLFTAELTQLIRSGVPVRYFRVVRQHPSEVC